MYEKISKQKYVKIKDGKISSMVTIIGTGGKYDIIQYKRAKKGQISYGGWVGEKSHKKVHAKFKTIASGLPLEKAHSKVKFLR